MNKTWVSAFSFIFLIFTAVTWSAPVPDTGQTKCYDVAGNVITCPSQGQALYGQDGNYSINPMSYTKLDGSGNALPDSATSWVMVRDNVTSLIWEVKTNLDGTPNYNDPHDADNTYTWYDFNPATNGGYAGTPGPGTDTKDFIKALNDAHYGGYSDWRLPTIKELNYITNYSIPYPGPLIDAGYFSNTQPSGYWSSTTCAFFPSWAWAGGPLPDGYITKGTDWYVRAVRGEQSGSLGNLVATGSQVDMTVTQAPTACTATLDVNFLLHLPLVCNFVIPGWQFPNRYWADFIIDNQFNHWYPKLILFKLTNAALITDPMLQPCPASTISSDWNIHVPDVLMPDGITHLWVDLEYSPIYSAGENANYFIVTDYGVVSNSYTDNGDGTVTDTSTGLMWQQADSSDGFSWEQALAYCEVLNLGGYTDWRLPTIKELISLVDYSSYNLGFNINYFPNAMHFYWSSTTDDRDSSYALAVASSSSSWRKISADYCHVRAVRGGQAVLTPPIPDIKANGQDDQITVSANTPISITVSLAPGSENGKLADWWIAYNAPDGWHSYNSNVWTTGLISYGQYPLSIISPVEFFYSASLSVGDYSFYTGVDMSANGSLDLQLLYYDVVQVHVK